MEREACKTKACSAEVFFAKNDKGRTIAIDTQPFARDEVPVERRLYLTLRAGEVPRVSGERPELVAVPEVYVAHAGTCPGMVPERELTVLQERHPALAARVQSYRR